MSKKKNAALLCAGMLAGLVLGGPAANAVSNILAERSVQPIYVDGTQVQILRLTLGITEAKGVQPFWPWRNEQLTQVFYSAPAARFAVEAWDMYKNGKFMFTRYTVQGL